MEDITVIESKDKKERTPAQKASIAKAIERLTEMRKKKAAEKEASEKQTEQKLGNTVATPPAAVVAPVIKAKRVYKRKDPVLPTILPPLPIPAAIAPPPAPTSAFDYSKDIADLKNMVAALSEKKQRRKVIIDDSSDEEEVVVVKKPKNVVAAATEVPAPTKVVKPTLDISLFSRR